jgi:hypothetical protein
MAGFLIFIARQVHASFTITGNQISTSSTTTTAPTPIPCGTTTPVQIIPAGTTLNSLSQNTNTNYFYICVKGGTAGTDQLFMVPAPVGSPSAAPSPEANASPGYGIPFPSGGADFLCTPLNFPTAGGAAIMSSRWDGLCTTALSVIPVTIGGNVP